MASYVIRHLEHEHIAAFRASCHAVQLKPETILADFMKRARPEYDALSDEATVTVDLRYPRAESLSDA